MSQGKSETEFHRAREGLGVLPQPTRENFPKMLKRSGLLMIFNGF